MGLKILVTGGSGLLGSALVRRLCNDHEVTATYLFNEQNTPRVRARSCRLDLSDLESAIKCLEVGKLDLVINAVGAAAVDRCETDRGYADNGNLAPMRNICEAQRQVGFRLFHISTDYVFNGELEMPDETAIPNPINYYGMSKLAAEDLLKAEGSDFVIIRVCSLYSKEITAKNNVFNSIVSALRQGHIYRAAEDLFSNPTEVSDLASKIADLVSIEHLPQILHLAPREYLSRYEFACKIAIQAVGQSSHIQPVKVEDLGLAAPRPKRAGLSSKLTSKYLTSGLLSASEVIRQISSSR